MKKDKQTFAASRAHVWLKCVASEENQKKGKNPFKERNALADEGTLIHARAARMLGKDIPETIAETQLFADPESDAQSVVDFYADAVKRIMGKLGGFIETDFSYESSKGIYRNIPDAMIWNSDAKILSIIDLKTGFIPVNAEANEQLILGAHAICANLKLWPSRIVGIIVSPRLSSIVYSDIQYDPNFFEKLDQEIEERKGKFVPGSHCKKCNILTKCKKFRDTLEQYLDPSIKDGLTSKPDEWVRTLAIAGPASKFFEELEKEAKAFIELGGTIPDFALRKSGGKRAWFREIPILDIAVKLGLKIEDLLEKPSLVSVAQAEKKLTKDKREILRTVAYQPQNVSLTTVNETSFLSRKGEKIISVERPEIKQILKKEGKENAKGKRKTPSKTDGKRKRS